MEELSNILLIAAIGAVYFGLRRRVYKRFKYFMAWLIVISAVFAFAEIPGKSLAESVISGWIGSIFIYFTLRILFGFISMLTGSKRGFEQRHAENYYQDEASIELPEPKRYARRDEPKATFMSNQTKAKKENTDTMPSKLAKHWTARARHCATCDLWAGNRSLNNSRQIVQTASSDEKGVCQGGGRNLAQSPAAGTCGKYVQWGALR